MMKIFVILLLAAFTCINGQTKNIAQFAVWKQKEGHVQNFENGYKQHLQWHKANNDPWDWYGWYIASGERSGQFIDATFNHSWKDFDQSIKPAEDREDNLLHVYPFGDVQTVFKVSYLPELSIAHTGSLKSKLFRMITLSLSDIEEGKKIIAKYREMLNQNGKKFSFLTFKMADGGNLNQFILLIGTDNFEDYGITENLQEELTAIEKDLKLETIISLISETLRYREDMSLFAK